MKNNYRNNLQDIRLTNLEKHIETINKELGDIKIYVAEIRKDVCWLKKFFWIVASASVGGLVTTILNLLMK